MGCLGVLFSISKKEVKKLKKRKTDQEKLEYLQHEIEDIYFDDFPQRLAELDKAWDALHRSLTNGLLEWKSDFYPQNHIILGGENLYQEDDFILVLKTPHQVRDIAEIIDSITREQLREVYYQIPEEDYGFDVDEDDFDYTWTWFQSSREFWKLAAIEKRYVIFTADQ